MKATSSNVIRVAIQRPLYKLLDYNYDQSLVIVPGMRVRVPLGNTKITAIVIDVNVTSEITKLKSIIEVIDETPLIDSSLLTLLKWASRYYFHPVGEVIFHALPKGLRKGKALPKLKQWRINSQALNAFLVSNSLDKLKRAPKQYAMFQLLKETDCDEYLLEERIGSTWKNILKQLEKKGLIEACHIDAPPVAKRENKHSEQQSTKQRKLEQEKSTIVLTQEQQNCIEIIGDRFAEKKPKPVLLYGVTGSGKTEVYFHTIAGILKKGKQALILVPEIGLTPQLLLRFKQHFSSYAIAALHSGLTDKQRLQNWLGAKSGIIDIIIGTRSAIFTPMKNLGVIVVDEEHDASFKQQEGFLYHGRDLAVKRAYDLAIPILLGSATPSLESLYNAEQNRYKLLRLKNRPGTRKRPKMGILDIRALALDAGMSDLLIKEVRQHIEKGQQVMLFLNRRGFAPVLMCPACGWHAVCRHCDIGMTYHASSHKVICHHCGLEETVGKACSECGNKRLTTQGQGTERIEKVLMTHFPNTPVIRIDRDSTSRKGALEKKLEIVKTAKPVILIGTQMLTKGHDFPNLTFVGILDVDQALFSMDFRAHEKLAQQIIQVAGRAGRGEIKGNVVLQSSQPEHPLLLSLLNTGYFQTATHILNERQVWNYPPYGAQALIRVSATKPDAGFNFLNRLSDDLKTITEMLEKTVFMLGPIASPLAKRSDRYRFQLLFSADKKGALHQILEMALPFLLTYRKTGGIRWSIDIDPIDFL